MKFLIVSVILAGLFTILTSPVPCNPVNAIDSTNRETFVSSTNRLTKDMSNQDRKQFFSAVDTILQSIAPDHKIQVTLASLFPGAPTTRKQVQNDLLDLTRRAIHRMTVEQVLNAAEELDKQNNNIFELPLEAP